MGGSMNNKKLGIIIGMIGVAIGALSLFNSTYITNIDGGDAPTTIFLSIRPDNQSLIIMIISLMTLVLGIIILLKGCVSQLRDK